jgi:hypothetical protein
VEGSTVERVSSKQAVEEIRSLLSYMHSTEPSRDVLSKRLLKLSALVKTAYDPPGERIAKAIRLIDYLPNAVAAWVEAHAGNKQLANENGKKLRRISEELGEILASMPKAMTYNVHTEKGSYSFKDPDDLIAKMKSLGFPLAGFSESTRHHPALRGQPAFRGLHGPMYDGGAVRYETAEIYRQMSI